MKKPSPDDLHIAAMWLDIHDGAEDKAACMRVRDWLLLQADAAEFRALCKEAGVPVAAARRDLATPAPCKYTK